MVLLVMATLAVSSLVQVSVLWRGLSGVSIIVKLWIVHVNMLLAKRQLEDFSDKLILNWI